eukprot:gb/GEZN01015323.1/.p1 GENE.gb/GEZN01015323.1/~~gb/GEZN01015323.1/.p1  ORF type:complete len:242 (+),score=27.69 gb/GEZN01015323.1/:108-833(+)
MSYPSSFVSHLFCSKLKTFKAQPIKDNEKEAKLTEYAKRTLGWGDLRNAVKLPEGVDLNEWLAINTVDFFNEIGILYGVVQDFCSTSSCPFMSAGPQYRYYWADGKKIRKPIEVSAPKYIELLLLWVEEQINDQAFFPVRIGDPYPKNLHASIRVIFKRLFRVYAHIYHSHFDHVASLGAQAHLNTCFKHFFFFVTEFKLVDSTELKALACVSEVFAKKDQKKREEEEQVQLLFRREAGKK